MPTPTQITPRGLRKLIERSERVFPSYPQVERYFPAASIEAARQRLCRAIERGDGPGLVVGAPGTGKSLLLQVLASQFQERFDVVLLACARVCTRRALLKAILFEMGLRYNARDEGELRLSLLDHLLSVEDCPEGLLLLVDEAQALSPALLDELRVLTNLVRGGAPRVRLVLAGSAALEESFACPELESFSQRLSARCYLAPFNREETVQFVRAQIGAVGGAPDDIFAANALTAVFEATDGVPRLINQLCDRALMLADAERRARIERDVVQEAWGDLQQLPTPWESPATTPATTATPEAVEFGSLPESEPAEIVPDSGESFVVEPTLLDDAAASNLTTCSYAVGDATSKDYVLNPRAVEHAENEIEGAEVVFPQARAPVEPTAVNPFAEKFDEEEILLDSFAAWDKIFHREIPRVQNRRDPGFATLVQAALDASPVFERPPESPAFKLVSSHTSAAAPSHEASTTLAFEDDQVDAWESDLPGDDASEEDRWNRWPSELCPPLRLADVSDPTLLAPDPRVASKTLPGAVSYDSELPAATGRASDWIAQVAIDPPTEQSQLPAVTTLTGRPWEELPVLMIDEDDDSPVPGSKKPTVRREAYRDLFSRLRGV